MPARIGYWKPPTSPQAEAARAEKREQARREAAALYNARPTRREANSLYSSARWRKLRMAKLAADPLCEPCDRFGRTTVAEHVHHRIPVKVDASKAFAWSNLESVCQPCHNAMEVR